ncbi:MAG: DUF1254 domain-containing protein [Deltaproteobacteria bacterium]|nr:DUF1254 domain-containing protein [Deltaproteobacteria bacterium]
MKFQLSIIATTAFLIVSACAKDGATPTSQNPMDSTTPTEATSIAEDAYIYAFPMMENYRTMYVQAIDRTAPGYAAPFNEFAHKTELLGPEFKDIVRPNNDTMYSFAWLDLRAQSIVITVPEIKDRYYSVQLVDMFTHNLGYIGTRATGTGAGSYVVAGPQWEGTKPGDAKAVFRSESNFVYCIIRTEVDGPDDVAAVVNLQKQYRLTAMNVFLGRSRVPVATGITFPSYDPGKTKSAGFIDLLNFLLTQVVIVPEEQELMGRFAGIGIQAGALSASLALSPELRDAVDAGVGQGMVMLAKAASNPSELQGVITRADHGWEGTDGIFGPGEIMRSKYLARALAAMIGLYGNDAAEAYYPIGNRDGSGDPLDGSKHRYMMRFEKEELPQVDAFWSMTMYGFPDQLMVANPINRYSIGDRSKLLYAEDGSLTIYIQHESPGKQKARNWLPAPNGPFSLQFRMYLPKAKALDPLYLPPPVRPVK